MIKSKFENFQVKWKMFRGDAVVFYMSFLCITPKYFKGVDIV